MSESIRVAELAAQLLALSKPLSAFDMPLLDSHGATLAQDIYSGDRVVLRAGSRIRATQIGLAASLGMDHLPTRPQPRVVVISAGDDLVEPVRNWQIKMKNSKQTPGYLQLQLKRQVQLVIA